LRRMRQPESLKRRIWEPLCISALNTLPERACARTFAAVLRESLGASRAASDFLLPRATLSDCLPDPVVAWLRARGAALHLRTPVRSLRRLVGTERSWRVDLHDGFLCARHVVLACGIAGTRRLLADLADEPDSRGPNPSIAQTLAALDTYTFEPIATIWTAWPSASWKTRPSPLMFAWATPENRFVDWLFDRGEQRGHRIGAMVVSVAGEAHVTFPADAALARARDVCRAQGLPEPSHARSVIERRATFVCTPNRPIVTLPESGILPGLWLAGDYTEADFPATLEAAVRSGLSVGKLAGRIQDHSQARASA
jgi:hypothetical protein